MRNGAKLLWSLQQPMNKISLGFLSFDDIFTILFHFVLIGYPGIRVSHCSVLKKATGRSLIDLG